MSKEIILRPPTLQVPPQDMLVRDYTKTEAIRLSNRAIERNIATFDATSDEVINWHFSRDPLYEADELRNNLADSLGPYAKMAAHKMFQRYKQLYENGAAILTMNVFHPELHNYTGQQRLDFLNQKSIQDLPKTSNPHDLISLCMLDKSQFRGQLYRQTELEHLRTAADLLMLAADSNQQEEYPIRISEKGPLRHFNYTRESVSRMAALKIYDLVQSYGLSKESDIAAQLIGLDSLFQMTAASLQSDSFLASMGEKNLSRRNQMIEKLITGLETVFVKHPERVGKYQGKLHELLWFIEMQFYLSVNDNTNVIVFPAQKAQDQPRSGYTEANRGIDFVLRDRVNQKNLFVQLKSGKKNGRYHPRVTIVKENIPNLNQTTLKSKVEIYKHIVRGDYKKKLLARNLFTSIPATVEELNTAGW